MNLSGSKHYFCKELSADKCPILNCNHLKKSMFQHRMFPNFPQFVFFHYDRHCAFYRFHFPYFKWTFFSDKPITSEYTEKFPLICGTEMQGNLGSIFGTTNGDIDF